MYIMELQRPLVSLYLAWFVIALCAAHEKEIPYGYNAEPHVHGAPDPAPQQLQQGQPPQQQQFQQGQPQQQQQFQQGQPQQQQQFQQGQPQQQQFQQGQPQQQQFQQGQPQQQQQFQQGQQQQFQQGQPQQQQQFQQGQQQQFQQGQPQQQRNVLDKSHTHDREHIKEHLDGVISEPDTSKMSEQELQFHYFKMHDNDNNNKLDGCELIKSLIHWHIQEGHQHGQKDANTPPPLPKVFTDQEMVDLIDPIMNSDDANRDGFIDYAEFVAAQDRIQKSQESRT